MDGCPDWMLKCSPYPQNDPSWHYPSCDCPDFVPSQRPRTIQEQAEDLARCIRITESQEDPSLRILKERLRKEPSEFLDYISGWKFAETVLKVFGEMSQDDFEKFQTQYRQQIRQDGKRSDKPSNPDSEKGSSESNEVHINQGNGSDI